MQSLVQNSAVISVDARSQARDPIEVGSIRKRLIAQGRAAQALGVRPGGREPAVALEARQALILEGGHDLDMLAGATLAQIKRQDGEASRMARL